ncbi:MAG: hypothetical protein QOE65_1436 [Solirubrobacteraceae bacterium]|jgi:hypothetical protein|nr:hypothetical protein [Solirubrobacteraceae bacterium]
MRRAVTASIVLAALVAPASAPGAAGLRFQLDLLTQTPASPTGARLRLTIPDRNGKPPLLRTVLYELPSGTVIDGTVVPACPATEDDFDRMGTAACPASTRVGGGSLTAVTGFGPPLDPLSTDAHIFQGHGEFIEVFTPPGTDRVVAKDHAKIGPGTLTLHPPASPGGPPDGHTTPRDIDFLLPQRSVGGRSVFRTPPDCPATRVWTSRATVTFDSGETVSATSTTPCSPAAGPAPRTARPRLHLTIAPRRVKVNRRTRFRLRLTGDRDCVAHAVVRFHGRNWTAGPDGKRALYARLRRAGRQRATVTAPGCRSASATVRAVS